MRHRSLPFLLPALLMLLGANACTGQQLPRRVFLGIRMERVTDDLRRIMGVGATPGVLVAEVLPGGSGEAAGWQRGDLLTELGGQPVASPDEVLVALAQHQSGSTLAYRLLRDRKPLAGSMTLRGWPEERYPDLRVEYTAHATVNGVQRAILTRPRTRQPDKAPLVAFIGGIGCYSLDSPLDTARSEVQLLNALSRMGYACARLEKPGMGDAARSSTACGEVSFMHEMTGYAEMIAQLKRRADIDSSSVTIIGHSMGGVFAPLVAQRTPVQRIVAYGTIGSNFLEHLLKTRRTIGEAYGWDAERTDAFIKDFGECAAWYFADRLSSAQAAARKPVCAEYAGIFDVRARAYNDELYALSIPAAWKGFRGRTLLLWGEADYIAARHDHELLRGLIEAAHPGSVTFQVVPDADHGMHQADDFKAAVAGSGPYQQLVGRAVTEWMPRVR
ncbi:MAG: alpha/beta fold hydrolase [Flavobacteriales bacterium]|nr:MAG: alpha/beta fold hydrolase [Flavobacteriales bacterium]